MVNFLKSKLMIQENSDQLLVEIQRMTVLDSRAAADFLTRMEVSFRIRCLERLHIFMRLAADKCFYRISDSCYPPGERGDGDCGSPGFV